jgi:hypothetical protein
MLYFIVGAYKYRFVIKGATEPIVGIMTNRKVPAFALFMETGVSLACSQELATVLYPEPDAYISHLSFHHYINVTDLHLPSSEPWTAWCEDCAYHTAVLWQCVVRDQVIQRDAL